MKRRTKIVCTLGPSSASPERIRELVQAGMNVARLNCSHGDWASRAEWLASVRQASPKLAPVAVLADLQGPKFRLGGFEGTRELNPGERVTLGPQGADLPLSQLEILHTMTPGAKVLLGDGEIELKVLSKGGEEVPTIRAKVVCGGAVRSKQGLTVTGRSFETPALTTKDLEDLREACRLGVDLVALSYVRCASDIEQLRTELNRYDPSVGIVAKIETREALRRIEEIVRVSDAIMVARGDLGLQLELEEVPLAQKRIIQVANRAGKPVITATQMLESMIVAGRPTRAEASDVANAVFDGTDALMLSGETAVGRYPVESVRTMVRIAERAERLFDHDRPSREYRERAASTIGQTEAFAYAVDQLAGTLRPKAIVTTTASGQTPRLVSKFRPRIPILCVTWNPRVEAQMATAWGVETIYAPLPTTGSTDDAVALALQTCVRAGRLKSGDRVLVTAGVPVGVPGHTNLILTETVP